MGRKLPKNKEEKRELRDTITRLTERLIQELQEEELKPMEKLALLKALLPYSVGKLPTAIISYSASPDSFTLENRLKELCSLEESDSGNTIQKLIS